MFNIYENVFEALRREVWEETGYFNYDTVTEKENALT